MCRLREQACSRRICKYLSTSGHKQYTNKEWPCGCPIRTQIRHYACFSRLEKGEVQVEPCSVQVYVRHRSDCLCGCSSRKKKRCSETRFARPSTTDHISIISASVIWLTGDWKRCVQFDSVPRGVVPDPPVGLELQRIREAQKYDVDTYQQNIMLLCPARHCEGAYPGGSWLNSCGSRELRWATWPR